VALAHFESALVHFVDHPSAIVGLSNILADIYSGDIQPPPSMTPIILPAPLTSPAASTLETHGTTANGPPTSLNSRGPLGTSLSPPRKPTRAQESTNTQATSPGSPSTDLDRLAARDRAYGLLSTLTKLGTGWNYSEAWFALARVYELGGQLEKSRECLWWCVELEESRAVRDWSEVVGGTGRGGYVA
jgi:hypothetical protein